MSVTKSEINANVEKYVGHETLLALESTVNITKNIVSLFSKYINKNVLEVGSGIGNVANFCNSTNYIGMEPDLEQVKIASKKFPELDFRHDDILNINLNDYKDINSILCVNVLEHIGEDKKALVNMRKILKKDGHLLLYVPANNYAYCDMDKSLGHHKRYTKKSIKNLLKETGFEIQELYNYNFLGLLGWLFYGKIIKSKTLPKSPLNFFDKFLTWSLKLEKKIHPPIGLSLVVVAKKNE